MLKLSRAMVGHVEAICQILFGHVGFVSQSAPPEIPRFKWVLGSYVLPIWGSNAGIEATFWVQIGAKLGHLGPR